MSVSQYVICKLGIIPTAQRFAVKDSMRDGSVTPLRYLKKIHQLLFPFGRLKQTIEQHSSNLDFEKEK